MKISCIVPVYNNSTTVEHVLSVLTNIQDISEVIAVDDKSTDNSLKKIKSFIKNKKPRNFIFLKHPKNKGKGAGLVTGSNRATGDVLLFCDADLSKLCTSHIQAMIDKFKEGHDMVIAARSDDTNGRDPITQFLATVSGERIFYRKNIEEYFDLIAQMGNGIEQITNFAHKDKDVEIIVSRDIGHVLKYERGRPLEWIWEYIQEIWQLIRTDAKLKKRLLVSGCLTLGSIIAGLFSFWYFKTRKKNKTTKTQNNP
ncbi:glycosyltransferase family 2 protein [Candidatus Dojkabacteria bacterium]|nr:glycosyltransferase family 2 protein [Candidatus Dojkabacteria bacterium]